MGVRLTSRVLQERLLFVQIFVGNIILGHLVRANFPLLSVPGAFHTSHYVSLERVSLFKQLVHALRIRTFDVGQSLQISRLPHRPRSEPFQSKCRGIESLTSPWNDFL